MGARLLVVEDEPSMLKGLMDVLAVKGYQAESAMRGDDALRMAMTGDFDLILLDVMLPGLSGFDVLRQLRDAGKRTPVMLLTAKNTEMDKVLGFELGVDDYVTKPFSLLELLGRIGALLRRSAPAPTPEAEETVIRFGAATVDLKRYLLTRDGKPLELPAKAFEVLKVLHEKQGEVVSRDTLMDEVWGDEAFLNQRTVNNLVVKIRQAIEVDAAEPRHLKTVHGVGYRLDL